MPEVVPRSARSSAPAPATATPPVTAAAPASPPLEATQVAPVVERNAPPPEPAPDPEPTRTAGKAKVPWWMQLLLWIVAVPLSFFVVFLLARVTGIFTHDELSDVFLADGADRFWPIVRLLPIVALVMAAFVQLGVVLLSRRNVRQGSRGR